MTPYQVSSEIYDGFFYSGITLKVQCLRMESLISSAAKVARTSKALQRYRCVPLTYTKYEMGAFFNFVFHSYIVPSTRLQVKAT